MTLTNGTDTADLVIDISDKKTIDKFPTSGKIQSINLILRKQDRTPFSIKIGERHLTEKDFRIHENYSWELNQTTIEGNFHCNSHDIEFNEGDAFELSQHSVNIWRIIMWISI